jgi:hypothetical protein
LYPPHSHNYYPNTIAFITLFNTYVTGDPFEELFIAKRDDDLKTKE